MAVDPLAVDQHRVAWLDSTRRPSRVHLTAGPDGLKTVCGHDPVEENGWTPTRVGMRLGGRSRACRTCFKDTNPRKVPWHPRCVIPT